MPEQVRVSFLGGLGEIGRNCAVIEVGGRMVVLDCGIMFPDADMPGIDLVLPDLSYLRENAEKVEGVVLTHGHEDHTGGLAYLLRDLSVPVYGSALTLGLARNRVEEAGLTDRASFVEVVDGERRAVGALRRRIRSPSPTRCPTGSPPPSTRRRGSSCIRATSSST